MKITINNRWNNTPKTIEKVYTAIQNTITNLHKTIKLLKENNEKQCNSYTNHSKATKPINKYKNYWKYINIVLKTVATNKQTIQTVKKELKPLKYTQPQKNNKTIKKAIQTNNNKSHANLKKPNKPLTKR